MAMSATKKREKHEFVQYTTRLTDEEHDKLTALAQILFAKGKIKKINPYNITHYALMVLMAKLEALLTQSKLLKAEGGKAE